MSAIDSLSTASPPSTNNAFNALGSEEFVRIMFTELTNQDPLEPTDTSQILEQISSIRAIESDLQLTDRLQSLVSQSELSVAGGLIGKTVSGVDVASGRVQDVVTSVSASSDGAVLNLAGGARVPMRLVSEISDPGAVDADGTPSSDDGGADEPGDS